MVMAGNTNIARRRFLQATAAATGLGYVASLTGCAETAGGATPPLRGPLGHGVSLAGAEFGHERHDFSNRNVGQLGVDYTYNSRDSITYFTNAGMRVFRVPFRWERLQPTLGGALDSGELAQIRNVVRWASQSGAYVVLDLHNYARYAISTGGPKVEAVIDQSFGGKVLVSRQHLADLWQRLAQEFRNEPAVAAYGLMNEPHDMGRSDWRAISQHTVEEIRKVDAHKLLLVAGDGWSNAHRFSQVNGRRAWISDPGNNVAYEAHCYFDHDHAGKYWMSYDQELARDSGLADRPLQRIEPFIDWCQRNGVEGFCGEFGVPADSRWCGLLGTFMNSLRQAGISSSYWAAGEWWGNYPLSIQPRGTRAAPQMAALTSVAAAPVAAG